jgi:hypothetical protein
MRARKRWHFSRRTTCNRLPSYREGSVGRSGESEKRTACTDCMLPASTPKPVPTELYRTPGTCASVEKRPSVIVDPRSCTRAVSTVAGFVRPCTVQSTMRGVQAAPDKPRPVSPGALPSGLPTLQASTNQPVTPSAPRHYHTTNQPITAPGHHQRQLPPGGDAHRLYRPQREAVARGDQRRRRVGPGGLKRVVAQLCRHRHACV